MHWLKSAGSIAHASVCGRIEGHHHRGQQRPPQSSRSYGPQGEGKRQHRPEKGRISKIPFGGGRLRLTVIIFSATNEVEEINMERQMAADRIIAQDYEVASRLDQLGLSASELIGVV